MVEWNICSLNRKYMKDIKELFEDACKPLFITSTDISFKEEDGGVQIIKGDVKMLFQGGTRDQLYTEVLRSLISDAFAERERFKS